MYVAFDGNVEDTGRIGGRFEMVTGEDKKTGITWSNESKTLRKFIPSIIIILSIPNLILIVQNFKSWFSGNRYLPLADGLYFWSGAHLALAGQLDTIFTPQKYEYWFATNFGGDLHTWGYPPSYLLFTLPFGFLSPLNAVSCFDILALLSLAFALRVSGFRWKISLAILFCPASLISFNISQNGAFIAGLMISGLWLVERRPWVAGILIGLVTIKPQLGILIPVYLLAQGNWRTLISASITSVMIIFSSAWLFGVQSWYMFVENVVPFMAYLLVQLTRDTYHGPRAMIMSVFSFFRQLGLGAATSMAFQTIAMLGAVALTWCIGRNKKLPTEKKLTWILLLGVLVTPYIWCYDMIPVSLAVAILIRSGIETGFLKGEFIILISLWMIPGLSVNAAFLGWPTFAPVLILLTLFYSRQHNQIKYRTAI